MHLKYVSLGKTAEALPDPEQMMAAKQTESVLQESGRKVTVRADAELE